MSHDSNRTGPHAGALPAQMGAGLGVASVPNMRDLGGWSTRDGGRVVRGAVYRSTDLSRLTNEDRRAVEALGIRAVFDLRTAGERAAAPDVLPKGAGYRALDILADSTMAVPANLMELLSDPKEATEALTPARVLDLFGSAYREIISLPSARSGYRELFSDLGPGADRPALLHCTTGKDRTGWAAAALLMLLGVSDEDVMAEYLLTNDLLLPALAPKFELFRQGGGDPEVLLPVFGVEPEYLNVALETMSGEYGSIEGYFSAGLGLDDQTLDALRTALIELPD